MYIMNGTKCIQLYPQQQSKKMLFILHKELRVLKIHLHPREMLSIHFQDLQVWKEIHHV